MADAPYLKFKPFWSKSQKKRISTQLRGVLQSLLAPTDSMVKLMEELGVADGKAMLAKYGLVGSIEQIIKKTEESGEPLQKYMGSIEGQTLALALAGAQNDTYKTKLGEMNQAQGATDKAFEKQTQGVNAVGFAMSQMQVQFEVSSQKIGEILLPYIGQAITDLLPSIQSLLDKVVEILPGVIKWFQDMGTEIKQVFAELKPVMDEFKEGVYNATEGNKENVNSFKEALIDLKDTVKETWTDMFKTISENSGFIGPIITTLIDLIIVNWTSALKTMEGFIKFFKGVFTWDFDLAVEGLKTIFNGWWIAVEGVVNGVIGTLKTIFDFLADKFNWIMKVTGSDFRMPTFSTPGWGSDGLVPPAPPINIPSTPAYMNPPVKSGTTNVFNITSPAPLNERETARQVGKVQSAHAMEML